MRLKVVHPIAVLACVAGPALLFAGCGDDADGARTTLAEIEPSSYVVKEPATTTSTLAPGQVDAEGRSPTEQEYTIQSGDYPLRIANEYGITVDELANYNEWTPPNYADFPFPGTVIKIPPNALVPGASSGSTDEEEPPAEEETQEPTTTLPGSDTCTEGTYTITENDTSRLSVAEQFDVTVDQLDAANAGTPGYASFYPGLEIVIPCAE